MGHYIDGFVLPVPRNRLDDYKRLVAAVAETWKEHGALDYREHVGDDLILDGTRSFEDLVNATEGGSDRVRMGGVRIAKGTRLGKRESCG